MALLVMAWKKVDLPTLASPTIPTLNLEDWRPNRAFALLVGADLPFDLGTLLARLARVVRNSLLNIAGWSVVLFFVFLRLLHLCLDELSRALSRPFFVLRRYCGYEREEANLKKWSKRVFGLTQTPPLFISHKLGHFPVL